MKRFNLKNYFLLRVKKNLEQNFETRNKMTKIVMLNDVTYERIT